MPSWGIHLTIAKKLAEKLQIEDKNAFLFGNLLPDVNNGYVIRDVSKLISHDITHYNGQQGKLNDVLPGCNMFYDKYQEKLENPVILGCLSHLYTDYYWNYMTYMKYGIFNQAGNFIGFRLNDGKEIYCSQEESRIIKTNDFKLFSSYVYQNRLLTPVEYQENLLNMAQEIEEVDISGNDIQNTISYIQNKLQNTNMYNNIREKSYYQIFNEEQLVKEIDNCVNYIFQEIEQKEIHEIAN